MRKSKFRTNSLFLAIIGQPHVPIFHGEFAKTFPENSFGNLAGVGLQSTFQGIGTLYSSFGGRFGYYNIFNQFGSNSNITPMQAYAAIWTHALGLMGKAAGAEAGKWAGTYVANRLTFGNPVAARWGAVTGSVAGGAFASYWVDKAEAEIFRQIGIE